MNTPILYFGNHSRKRASQRGITAPMIYTTIEYGVKFFKQDLRYYVALFKDLPGNLPLDFREQVSNTVVLVNSLNEIVTCYKNRRAIRNIKRKPKRLLKGNK